MIGVELPEEWVKMHHDERGFTDEEWNSFIKVYGILHHKMSKSSPIIKTLHKEVDKKKLKSVIRDRTQMVLAGTGIRRMRKTKVEDQFPMGNGLNRLVDKASLNGLARPSAASLTDPYTKEECMTEEEYRCYGCSIRTKQVHFFYDKLCLACGGHNWEHRTRERDLSGKIAMVTGGRVKIGYQAVLKLLRCGATVYTTTRFPMDACQRYAKEVDFSEWDSRLHVMGPLDFKDLKGLSDFCEEILLTLPKIDILINNAAQTIGRHVIDS